MTANNEIEKIMESMGWTDGTFIPIANEENKILMQGMQEQLAEKESLTDRNQELDKRATNLKQHIVNSQSDILQNAKLIEAHRSQLNDEQHMSKIAEYEDGTLAKKHKEVIGKMQDLDKYDQTTREKIAELNANMERLSGKIQWSRDALQEWTEAMARGDETNKLIAKYCMEDEQLANNLEVKRRSVQIAISKQRTQLVNVAEEAISAECILDRTAQLYRLAHAERRQMVDTWKEAVNTMLARDHEISAYEKDMEAAKVLSERKDRELKEQEEFFEQQVQNNREAERSIVELNADMTRLRHTLTDAIESVALRSNEFVTTKKLAQNLANRLQQQRHHNRQAAKDQQDKEAAHEQATATFTMLKEKFGRFNGKRFNAQERLKHLDELVESEEKTLTAIAAETTRLGGALFRSQQLLLNWQNEHKVLEMEIKNLESSIVGNASEIKELQQELSRQTEIIYNVDFKMTEYESRVARMKGSSSDANPETEVKVAHLERAYVQRKKEYATVKAQVLKVEDDMRRLTLAFGPSVVELEKLDGKLKQRLLECEGGAKSLEQRTLASQERLVDESILRMRVHQMTQSLQCQKDKMYNLERHKADLELTMNERIIEINMQTDLLRLQRKHINEELSQLRADMAERSLKIQALMARYDNAIELLGKNEDGSVISATQIKIETAQEKQILLRDGNELNEKVINAEKDIKAIENTLLLLNYSNETYKKTLEPVNEDNREMCELNDLNNRYAQSLSKLKECKSHIVHKSKAVNDLKEKRDELEKDLEDISRFRLENNDTLMKIHKEILEQKSKKDRAQRELKMARKMAKQKISDVEFFASFEKDLNLKELEMRNSSALQQLADMVDAIHGMGPIVSKHLYEKGLSIPQSAQMRSQTSHRSDHSGRGSEYSLKLGSVSSKHSQRSFGSSGSSGSQTSQKTRQSVSLGPAVIQLDFPGDNSMKSSASRSSLNRSSRQY